MTVILALYPNSRGFGYACIQLPHEKEAQKLLGSGIINVRPVGNERVLKHVRRFAEYYRPKFVLLRDYHKPTHRGKRIRELLTSIKTIAGEYSLPVFGYTRQQIKETFERCGATTKYEIAQQIITAFPELASRAPRIRKMWESEEYSMGAFDAIALAMTHSYIAE